MGEMIAFPLTSERRAAVVLATLRRLEAEYQGGRPAADDIPRRIAGDVRVGIRRVLRGLRAGTKAAPVGGLFGLTIAAFCATAADTNPWLDGLLGGAGGAPLVVALGLVVGLMVGLALDAARRRKTGRGAANDSTGNSGNVSWLVSYVTVDPDGSGSGGVRTTAVQITLPEVAEGRLKAILERARAAATSTT